MHSGTLRRFQATAPLKHLLVHDEAPRFSDLGAFLLIYFKILSQCFPDYHASRPASKPFLSF